MARQTAQTKIRRKEKKNITNAIAHVNSSFNNTVITITDIQGNTVSWSSAGTMGFKGSRKSTPYAAQLAAEDAGKKASEHGVGLIMDMVLNHIGSGHAWVQDKPSKDWLNNQGVFVGTTHKRESLHDPHAIQSDIKAFSWFNRKRLTMWQQTSSIP